MMKAIWLHILRVVFMAATWGMWQLTGRLRYRWLFHYLRGSGKPLDLPAKEIAVIQSTLAGLWMDARRHVEGTARSCGPRDEVSVGLWHTTLYEGSGFTGRPEAFYTVGCFTYRVVVDYLSATVAMTATDEYDWHASVEEEYDEESETFREVECWYTSPVPEGTPAWIVRLAAKVLGNEYFSLAGWPMGQAGVSNKLWADLAQVGAKPFTTMVAHSWSLQEWRSLAGCVTRGQWGYEAGVRNWDEAPYRHEWRPEPEPVIAPEEDWFAKPVFQAFIKAQERLARQQELAEQN